MRFLVCLQIERLYTKEGISPALYCIFVKNIGNVGNIVSMYNVRVKTYSANNKYMNNQSQLLIMKNYKII